MSKGVWLILDQKKKKFLDKYLLHVRR